MAIRFGSCLHHAASAPVTFGTSEYGHWTSILAGAQGSIAGYADSSRLYIAPACYSEVRKVVFWAVFRQEHTGTALSGVNVRLRVAPSSTSFTARNIESKLFGTSTSQITEGAGTIWSASNGGITNEAALYTADDTKENLVAIKKFGTLATTGQQLVFREFDRFDVNSEAFFADWDSVANTGNENRFVAYWLALQRRDGVAWANSGTANQQLRPVLVSAGCSVVQAPSTENRSRIHLPCTAAMRSAINTTYAGSVDHAHTLFYHADEWSGDFEVRIVMRQKPGAGGGTRGHWFYRLVENPVNTLTFNQLAEEEQGTNHTNNETFLARSMRLDSFLQDGKAHNIQMRSATGALQDMPWGWWEITTRSFNKVSVFFGCGNTPSIITQLPTVPPTINKAEGLFDPTWFEDFAEERILSRRLQGGLIHNDTGNNSSQVINTNSHLEDDVTVSTFNVTMVPDISSTPINTAGFKYRDDDITSGDPMNLAGKRKLTERFLNTWTAGVDDDPGRAGLLYVLDVPNTEFLELGPLFDVGTFEADGCAATSAGLGEPALLIITNGATIPKKFNPAAAGSDGEVEDAGIPTPFEGETPQAVPGDYAISPTGGLGLGTYKYRYTFRNCCTNKESDPNPEDIEVDTSAQSPAAKVTFSFAGVRIPADMQICEICLYRTVLNGDFPVMAKVGCFDPDVTSTFVDTLSDAALDFTNDGLSILNAPMPCVPIVVDFRNRLFGMGDIPNLATEGTVSVVQDSDLIHGDGDVLWDRCLEGKFIQVGADCRAYEILRVLPPEAGTSPAIARLRLVEEYEGQTGTGLSYTICGRPNRLYFSEPLEPEYWPAANFLDVEPGDGDRLMGAVSNFDRLVICKRRKSYVLTFRENPGIEVIVPSRISSDIGCVGPRSFAQIESGSVWLAERGLALFDGRTVQHVEESVMMNDLFVNPDNPNYIRRDRNGRVIQAAGVFYPARQQYLLLLPTKQTRRGCNLMLVWDVKLRNITLLKFCQEFLSITVAKDAQGNERVYMGDTNGFVWIYDIGHTDGVGFPNATGTVRGTVTSAGIDVPTGASIMDVANASFLVGGVPSIAGISGVSGFSGFSGPFGSGSMGLAGVCVFIRRAGAGQDEPWIHREIYASTSGRLYVTPQWGPDTPNPGDEFMLGAIEMDLIFKPQNYGTDDSLKRNWRQVVVHEVEAFASQLRVDLLPDFQLSDPDADAQIDPLTQLPGSGRIFRMDFSKGRQTRPTGREIHNFEAVRMRNFAPEEPIQIINHILMAEPRTSK